MLCCALLWPSCVAQAVVKIKREQLELALPLQSALKLLLQSFSCAHLAVGASTDFVDHRIGIAATQALTWVPRKKPA